jgi:GMP synthase (glutamine-hydrolysing)
MAVLPPRFRAFQWHGYGFATPPSATELARGTRGPQAFKLSDAPAWGIQFHAEVDAPTVESWIAVYGEAAGIDADALRAETRRELPRWNELGRALCAQFLEQAPL